MRVDLKQLADGRWVVIVNGRPSSVWASEEAALEVAAMWERS